MNENCPNCKFEPDWQFKEELIELSRLGRKIYTGHCKWNKRSELKIPRNFTLNSNLIYKFDDDMEFKVCPTWEPK